MKIDVKRFLLFLGFLLSICFFSPFLCSIDTNADTTSPHFDDYFIDETMRIDFYQIADKNNEWITLDRVYRQGSWAGNPKSLFDPCQSGRYYAKIFDVESKRLIFSKGFSSYCSEYVTTEMAAKGIKRTFHETALIPFPKNKVLFKLERRDRENKLHSIFEVEIDPKSIDINKEPLPGDVKVFNIHQSGDPHFCADLAFLAEGYTAAEEENFKEDLKKIADLLLNTAPYKNRKDRINIYGVFKASVETGTDEPVEGIYRNTALGTTFNALGLDRYLLTEENRAVRDMAAHVPYDTIAIIVNHKRYGGGGMFNEYCAFTMNKEWSGFLFLHEFGHSFGGLADEYYLGSVAYNEFYPPGIEPTDPNITALPDPMNLKWKHLVKKGTAIPTDWEKDKYEKMDSKSKQAHLEKEKYKGVVGAFEGAGYASKNLYRPTINCIMFSRELRPYCPVCEEFIDRVIDHYTQSK